MPRISSALASQGLSWPQVYLGVALTTLATLLLELSLTRIFSVVFYYHFAFLAISIALFGLGAGGVFSYVVAGWQGSLFRKLGILAALNSVLVVGALSLVLLGPSEGKMGFADLALVYFAAALPFFFAGAIVSLAISETIERVDRVYFFDLMGAAAGCLALIPLLNVLGGPNTVIGAGVLFAASSAIWFNLAGAPRGRALSVFTALLLVALIVFNLKGALIDVRYAKGQQVVREIFSQWNSFSRIGLAPERDGSGMMSIVIDADASTGIANFNFDQPLTERQLKDLRYQGPGFPYLVRPAAKTLIIGPGGGWDVARALASGSKDVTGVEINNIIADTIMRRRFPELSQRLYFRPEVRIVVEDGRSFVRRSSEKYQVLQMTLVDTWASTAAGAFALSENNLYTVEAFRDYLQHLTDDGILAFTRWGFDPPRESLRLLSLARVALGELGEREAWRHVMVIREGGEKELQEWGARDTVLVSRKPFQPADLARAREGLSKGGMYAVYLPDQPGKNHFADYLLSKSPREYEQNYQFDISPVRDNQPFFFYSVQPRDLWSYLMRENAGRADFKINIAVPMLFGLIAVSVIATLVILALPPLLLGSKLPREKGVLKFLTYFVCIGAGYILIQVALIQKFVLFLGHPTYALTVIVFSMLVSSSLGSYYSRRVLLGDDKRLAAALGAVFLLVVMLALLASPVSTAGVGWPPWLKFATTVLLVAPAGFAMGMPFPTGLYRLENWHKPSVRWAWSLNAASSVLGSAGAIFLAIYIGLQNTLLVGGVLYLLALASVWTTQPQRASTEPLLAGKL
ncbi:MAG: hypothetical protein SFV54_19155 [Bryobacteraceae bacterium]|nr:hypothetical protein [Bryobacteraceae bacterium]